jgi:hypothetical protein
VSQVKTKFIANNAVTNAKLALATAGTVLTGQGVSTVAYTATPTLGINATTGGTLALANGSASGASVVFQNLGTTTTWNFNLPITAGSAGQVLTSQGGASASMTWTTLSSLSLPQTQISGTAGQVTYIDPTGFQGGDTAFTFNDTTKTLNSTHMTATDFTGHLIGNSDTSTTATNLAGGLGGSIPYQTAVNTTAMLSNGSAGQVLTSNGTTLAPSWTTPSSTLTGLGIFAGKASISSGATSKAITVSTAYGNTNYAVTATIMNTTDANPQFIPVTVTAQATTGFTCSWNAPLPTASYVLSWTTIANN